MNFSWSYRARNRKNTLPLRGDTMAEDVPMAHRRVRELERSMAALGLLLIAATAALWTTEAAFVGVSFQPTTSSDGITWDPVMIGTGSGLKAVTYGNGVWLAVGAGAAYTSPNGYEWTQELDLWGQFAGNNGVAYGTPGGNPLFVVVGNSMTSASTVSAGNQVIYTSPDANTWTQRPTNLPSTMPLQGVAWGAGKFVAVGFGGNILTSSDGTIWTPVLNPPNGPNLYSVAFATPLGVPTFIAVGAGGTIKTSPDGQSWTTQTSGTFADLRGVDWGGGKWLAVGTGGAIRSSANGVNWAPQSPGTPNLPALTDVAYGGGRWVAVSNSQAPNSTTLSSYLITSTDGSTWNSRPVTAHYTKGPIGVAYANGQWVGVGTQSIVRSLNGLDWTLHAAHASDFQYGAASNGKLWISVGRYGTIYTSTDRENWTVRHAGAVASNGNCCIQFNAASWGAGQFVAVGTGGRTFTSPDGIRWSIGSTGITQNLNGVAYGPGAWVAVGDAGTVLTSYDGVSWQSQTISAGRLWDVAYGNGLWQAVGDMGNILSSTDGITWVAVGSPTSRHLYAIEFDQQPAYQWLASGADGTILGANPAWQVVVVPFSMGSTSATEFSAIAYDEGTWVVAGSRLFTSASGGPGTWQIQSSAAGIDVADEKQPPLECLPVYQTVASGSSALVGAGGGKYPYAWIVATPHVFLGQGVIQLVTPPLGNHIILISDSSTPPQQVECAIQVIVPRPAPARNSQADFVAVGAWIGYSHDGYDWYPANYTVPPGFDVAPPIWDVSPTAAVDYMYGVGHNGTHWIAAGRGYIFKSSDGINWNFEPTPLLPNADQYAFCLTDWGFGRWIMTCVDWSGSGFLRTKIITSTDGSNWVPLPDLPSAVFTIAHNGTAWLLAGQGTYHSSDGLNWVPGHAGLPLPFQCCFFGAAFHQGKWFIAGSTGIAGPEGIYSSSDGAFSWNFLVNNGWNTPWTLASNQAALVGFPGWTTTDGISWLRTNPFFPNNPQQPPHWALAYGRGLFIQSGKGIMGVSPDGYQWTHHPWPWGPNGGVRAIAASRAPNLAAGDDAYTLNEDQGPQVLDVTRNDAHRYGGQFAIVSNTQPTKGTLVGPIGGNFIYRPDPDATGSDAFQYTIETPSGGGPVLRATSNVTITLNPVNDAPAASRTGGPVILSTAGRATHYVPGWLTSVAPGPLTATDEAHQQIRFVLASMSNSPIFAAAPMLERTLGPLDVLAGPPHQGAFARLRLDLTGEPGLATICFAPIDNGGTTIATNSWSNQAQGEDLGPTVCGDVVVNKAPIAYFEASAPDAGRTQTLTFNPCPRLVPLCSHDPDGEITQYLWEFGDGKTSSLPTPSHAYVVPGTYLARLTVWDNYGVPTSFQRDVLVQWSSPAPMEEPVAARVAPRAAIDGNRTVLEGTLVQLAGSAIGGSDPRFWWRQLAGREVRLLDADTPTPSFIAPHLAAMEPETLVFMLQVGQDSLISEPTFVHIRVVSANLAPIAVAGRSQTVQPGQQVNLDGRETLDPNGDFLSFSWKQVPREGTPLVDMLHSDTAQPVFIAPPKVALLHFQLTVSDGKATSQDHVTVEVLPIPASNKGNPPVGHEPLNQSAWYIQEEGTNHAPVFLGAALYVLLAVTLVTLILHRRQNRSKNKGE
jgi:hypothetical protein